MISITPPVAKPYIPSTQKIASVSVLVQMQPRPDGTYQWAVRVFLWDDAKRGIIPDAAAIPPMTAAELAAFAAAPCTASETQAQSAERKLLPYLLRAYGLTGAVQ